MKQRDVVYLRYFVLKMLHGVKVGQLLGMSVDDVRVVARYHSSRTSQSWKRIINEARIPIEPQFVHQHHGSASLTTTNVQYAVERNP